MENMQCFLKPGVILLIYLVLHLPAKAQTDFRPGYIVTNDKDTISGLVDYRGFLRNSRVCTFRKYENDKPTAYNPDNLKGYGFVNSRFYESKIIQVDSVTRERVFLEVLVKGRVNLYHYKGTHKDAYFADKDTIPPMELIVKKTIIERNGAKYNSETKAYLGVLNFLMRDCPVTVRKLPDVSLEYKKLVELVEMYNQCFEEPKPQVRSSRPFVVVHTGPILGLNRSRIKFFTPLKSYDYLTKPGYSPSISGTVGWFLNTTLPWTNEKVSLQLEAVYRDTQYSAFYKVKSSIVTNVYNDVFIRNQYARIPLLLRYTYPKGSYQPFFNVGFFYEYALRSENILTQETETRGTVNTVEQKAFDMRKSQHGFQAGLGVRSTRWKKNVFLEARFERGNGVNTVYLDGRLPYSRTTALNLLLYIGL